MHGLLADAFEERVVLTWVTVASVGRTVEPGREALAVELEAPGVPAIASFTRHWSRGWELGCERLRSRYRLAWWHITVLNAAVSNRLLQGSCCRDILARLIHEGTHSVML